MKVVSVWSRNTQAVDDARRQDSADHEQRVRRKLKVLVEAKLCHRSAVVWFGPQSLAGERTHASFKYGDGQMRGHPVLTLKKLEHLQPGAILSMSFLQEKRSGIVLAYSVGLSGRTSGSGRPWYARVDLDQEQKGQGPCGHPNLHCHVGGDPEKDEEPQARVPLPWLAPDEALTWLLATVDQRFEPREG